MSIKIGQKTRRFFARFLFRGYGVPKSILYRKKIYFLFRNFFETLRKDGSSPSQSFHSARQIAVEIPVEINVYQTKKGVMNCEEWIVTGGHYEGINIV